MTDLTTIFIANGIGVLLLIMLLLNSEKSVRSRMPDNVLFYIMVCFSLLQCIAETASFLLDGVNKPGVHELMLVINSCLFINGILFTYTWTMYCDYKLYSDMNRIKKRSLILGIPAALIIVGSIANLFTPVFFSVSEANVYARTPLFFITGVVIYAYLLYGMVLIYCNRGRGRKYLFMPAVVFMIPIVVATVLQCAFYGLSLIWTATAISLVSLYINVQNEISYIDALSGIYNRQYLDKYLEEVVHRGVRGIVFGIMIDIDSFKKINDRFGHLVGDDAIKCTGGILRSCLPGDCIAVRYGGDEFVVIGTTSDITVADNLVERIKKAAEDFNSMGDKPYSLTFSAGCSIYNPHEDNPDSFINRIDIAMYEDKYQKY